MTPAVRCTYNIMRNARTQTMAGGALGRRTIARKESRMDPGLVGTVSAACWLAYRYRELAADIEHQEGRAAALHPLAVGLAGVSFLVAMAMMFVATLSLTGTMLGPSAATLYVDACSATLGLVMLVEATGIAYRMQSSTTRVRPQLATVRR